MSAVVQEAEEPNAYLPQALKVLVKTNFKCLLSLKIIGNLAIWFYFKKRIIFLFICEYAVVLQNLNFPIALRSK